MVVFEFLVPAMLGPPPRSSVQYLEVHQSYRLLFDWPWYFMTYFLTGICIGLSELNCVKHLASGQAQCRFSSYGFLSLHGQLVKDGALARNQEDMRHHAGGMV